MAVRPDLKVVDGGKDIVDVLERALERAKSGEFKGLTICFMTDEEYGWTGAVVDGVPFSYPRLLASVADCQAELIANGIGEWK